MISGSNPGILIKRIIAYAFTVLVMVSIFSFSAQPASRSANTSKGITKKIVNAITKNKNISQKKKNEMVKNGTTLSGKLPILLYIYCLVPQAF